MLQQQDKYQEVTTAVYDLIAVNNGITANDLMFQLPQYTEGLIQRSISLLTQQNKVHESLSNGASKYYTI